MKKIILTVFLLAAVFGTVYSFEVYDYKFYSDGRLYVKKDGKFYYYTPVEIKELTDAAKREGRIKYWEEDGELLFLTEKQIYEKSKENAIKGWQEYNGWTEKQAREYWENHKSRLLKISENAPYCVQ